MPHPRAALSRRVGYRLRKQTTVFANFAPTSAVCLTLRKSPETAPCEDSFPTIVFLLAPHLHAQQPGPVLKLTTASGQTTFHIGERIPIVFSFTGPDSFTVSMLPINRMSGVPTDDISASPADNTADPLAQYLAYTVGAFSVPNGHLTLSSKPVTRTANLNEWLRFDAPGTYAVSAISHRVILAGKSAPFSQDGPKLQSNTLELHIVPATSAWQKATLTRALHDIAVPAPENSEPSESRTAASQDLRYLATPEAIAALASKLTDDNYDLKRGAIEGPRRPAALPPRYRTRRDESPHRRPKLSHLRRVLRRHRLPATGRSSNARLRALR